MKVTERKSNFELLRILSILLIISFHSVFKSGYQIYTLSLNNYLIKVCYFFGELGVNLFILITGYFMITEKMSIKRVILLITETFFYNLLNVLLNYFIAGKEILILDVLFPVILGKYWFVTAYIVLYILSPYLNILIKNLKKVEHLKLIILLVSIWCIIPTIFGLTKGTSETLLNYTRLVWFIIIYFIGAYIRLYDIKIINKLKNRLIIIFLMTSIMLLSIPIIYKYRVFFNSLGTIEWAYLWTPNNVFMLILSICLFYSFLKLDIKSIKIINIIASTTLGIYMLHDGLFYDYMWNGLFNAKINLAGPNPLLFIIIVTGIIFVVGVIIDLIRQFIEKYTIKKLLYSKRINKILFFIKSH